MMLDVSLDSYRVLTLSQAGEHVGEDRRLFGLPHTGRDTPRGRPGGVRRSNAHDTATPAAIRDTAVVGVGSRVGARSLPAPRVNAIQRVAGGRICPLGADTLLPVRGSYTTAWHRPGRSPRVRSLTLHRQGLHAAGETA